MKHDKEYVASHRCPESLKQHASVRKMQGWNKEIPAVWCIGNMSFDSECGFDYMDYNVFDVSYCPYCGKKLKE